MIRVVGLTLLRIQILSPLFLGFFLGSISGLAQNPVTIRVNAAQTIGHYKPIYGYFGYDEPNYTYMANGRKLVGELARLSRHTRIYSYPFHVGDRRRSSRIEMGIDECI
jgi:hypothetical protein